MKRCKVCKEKFTPYYLTTQPVCNKVSCISEWGNIQREKKQEAARKAQRKDIRERKAKLKTCSDHAREAQQACNRYIRKRDEGRVCISCQKPPKKANAGHYLSVGEHPEVRYHPMNIWLQCEHCNTYKSGNQALYRINLIEEIGLEMVEFLESHHQPQKLSKEDLIQIKKHYNEQYKLLTEEP